MISTSRRFLMAGLISAVTFQAANAQEQDSDKKPPSENAVVELTIEVIEQRRTAAETADVDDAMRSRLAELYRQSLEQIRHGQAFSDKQIAFQARRDGAEQAAIGLKAKLESLSVALEQAKRELESRQAELASTEFVPEEELNELEQARSAADQNLKELRLAQTQLETESASRANRRKEIRERQLSVDAALLELKKDIDAPAPAGEPAPLTLAKRTEMVARRQALTRERPALENELQAFDAEDAADKRLLDRDVVTQKIAVGIIELQSAELLVQRKSDRIANDAVQAARTELQGIEWEFNRPLADRNLELAVLNRSLNTRIAEAVADRKKLEARLESLRREFELTKKKVDNVGLPASVGAQLRNQRSTLRNRQAHQTAIRLRQPTIDDAQLMLFDLDDERKKLDNIDLLVRRHLLAEVVELDRVDKKRAAEEAGAVLGRRTAYLDPLTKRQTSYFDALAELSITQQQLVEVIDEFSDFIDERVLWIRSGPTLFDDLDVTGSVLWLGNSRNWTNVGQLILTDVKSQGFLYVLVIVPWLLMLRYAANFRSRIRQIGEQVQRTSFSQFKPTLHAALLTLALSVVWPWLIMFLGWRLSVLAVGDEFVGALSSGLTTLGWAFLCLEFPRQSCRSQGLAECHFQGREKSVRNLRSSIRYLMLPGLPIVLVGATLQASANDHGRNTLERILFVVGSLILAGVVGRVLHPRRGVFHYQLALHPERWASRLRHFWFFGAIAVPLALGLLTILGYYYTAQQLGWRAFTSLMMVLGLLMLSGFVRRLLIVHRRRLSIHQARLRRAARLASDTPDHDGGDVHEQIPVDDALGDLSLQTSQTRRLLSTLMIGTALISLWIIWADVLPALDFLERWPIWSSTTQVTESITTESGDVQSRTRDVSVPTTVVDLLLAVLIAALTLVAAQNLPGLLEIAVLQRLPLEASIRYAITTLGSYIIMLVGLIAACHLVGLRWTQIQWMATALTFGLAFGLQEMFANFVAGVIILFERPIRVGDIVTVDEISGVVSRVRIRATTITDWDRKDFIVPNKDFITGRVLNWTLSDQVNRIVVNVGVAYGSDTAAAKDIMHRIALEHPQIVDEPPPQTAFEQFGASSLDISLRCFISLRDMASRLKIIDEVHSSIDREFKLHGIEIAFPQTDLHVRSFTPTVGLERRNAKSEELQ